MHNIFNLCDTEVAICIIIGLLKKVVDLNHYFYVR
jgi:hypothetical protein